MTIPRVARGQPIKPDPLNQLVDAVNRIQSLTLPLPPELPAGIQSGNVIFVINKTGGELRLGDVGAIDLSGASPFPDSPMRVVSEGPTIKLRAPTEDDAANFLVMSQKTPDNQGGWAWESGVVLARVEDVVEGSAGYPQYADIDVGASASIPTVLTMMDSGSARVLTVYGETADDEDNLWAMIRFSGGANGQGILDNPATVGEITEAEAADDTTWDRDDQASAGFGVQVVTITRVAYDDGGDETLYAYYRTLTYDSRGALVTISAETCSTIDVPEACT